jgi:hypothetical protein
LLNFAEKNRVELEKALKMTITISGFSELLHDQSPNTQKRGVLPFQHDSESYGDPEKSWVDMADRQINVFLFFLHHCQWFNPCSFCEKIITLWVTNSLICSR